MYSLVMKGLFGLVAIAFVVGMIRPWTARVDIVKGLLTLSLILLVVWGGLWFGFSAKDSRTTGSAEQAQVQVQAPEPAITSAQYNQAAGKTLGKTTNETLALFKGAGLVFNKIGTSDYMATRDDFIITVSDTKGDVDKFEYMGTFTKGSDKNVNHFVRARAALEFFLPPEGREYANKLVTDVGNSMTTTPKLTFTLGKKIEVRSDYDPEMGLWLFVIRPS